MIDQLKRVGGGAVGLAACARKHGQAARAALVLAVFVMSSVAFAADDNKVIYPGSSAKSETVSAAKGGNGLNTMTLVVGLALAGVGGWLVWRNRRGVPMSRETRALAIDETRALGNRQFLVVASYSGKKFLIGVCPGSISMLTALPEPERDEEAGA